MRVREFIKDFKELWKWSIEFNKECQIDFIKEWRLWLIPMVFGCILLIILFIK